jgi:hypothetical protein
MSELGFMGLKDCRIFIIIPERMFSETLRSLWEKLYVVCDT